MPAPPSQLKQYVKGIKRMKKNDRFEKIYSQGTLTAIEIWVDRETGVNYLYHINGYSGGLTPLLDRDGKPIVSPVYNGRVEG